MGNAPFILDRPDFQLLQSVLPLDEERDRLAERLRAARDAYLAHANRRPALLAEIEAVGRELVARPGDTKLAAKSVALSAELSLRPKIAEELAAEYARSLSAWCLAMWHAFRAVHDEAVDAINADREAWTRAARLDSQLPYGTPERAQNDEEIRRLKQRASPHVKVRDTCAQGCAAVETALSMGIGARVVYGGPQHGDIERFVARSRQAA